MVGCSCLHLSKSHDEANFLVTEEEERLAPNETRIMQLKLHDLRHGVIRVGYLVATCIGLA